MSKNNVLNDFIARFGDPDENSSTAERPKVKQISHLASEGNTELGGGLLEMKGDQLATEVKGNNPEGINIDAGGLAVEALGMAPGVMSLIDNAKGGQFETGADSGGPGKAGGAILQGAATGAELGKAAGPYGAAAGAVVGGLISTFAHSKASKEYKKNGQIQGMKEDALEKAKRKEEYGMSEGLASMENLKNLRQKQLGLS